MRLAGEPGGCGWPVSPAAGFAGAGPSGRKRSSLVGSATYFSSEDCVLLQATGVPSQSSGGHRSPRSRRTFSTTGQGTAIAWRCVPRPRITP